MADEGADKGGGTRLEGTELPSWFLRAVITVVFALAALLFGYRMFLWLRPLLLILLVSFFVALAVEPAVNILARRGWRRGIATFAVFAGVAIVGVVFTVAIGGILVDQVSDLIRASPRYVRSVIATVNERFGTDVSANEILAQVTSSGGIGDRVMGGVAGSAFALAGTAFGFVFNLFTILLFTFYLVADAPRFRLTVQRVLPTRHRATFVQAWALAVESTGGYLYSRALLAGVSALVHGVAFTLVGVPQAVALALWVGAVSQLVPSVGTYIAGVLPLLVALAADPTTALWTLGVLVVYQQVENYVIAPPLTARTMSLHPAVAFGSVIAGALVLGPVGALLALPAAAMIAASIATWGRFPGAEGEFHSLPDPPPGTRLTRNRNEPLDDAGPDDGVRDTFGDLADDATAH